MLLYWDIPRSRQTHNSQWVVLWFNLIDGKNIQVIPKSKGDSQNWHNDTSYHTLALSESLVPVSNTSNKQEVNHTMNLNILRPMAYPLLLKVRPKLVRVRTSNITHHWSPLHNKTLINSSFSIFIFCGSEVLSWKLCATFHDKCYCEAPQWSAIYIIYCMFTNRDGWSKFFKTFYWSLAKTFTVSFVNPKACGLNSIYYRHTWQPEQGKLKLQCNGQF